MTDSLATRQTVLDLVRTYEECEREIRDSFARVDSAQRKLGATFSDGKMSIRGGGRFSFDFDDPDRVLAELRRSCWSSLIERLDLRRVMSIKRWEALSKQVNDGPLDEVPPITAELVLGMAENFRSQIPTMIRESVAEVYDWLRPHRSEYKTNSEFGIGKRVILNCMVARESWGWRTSYYYSQRLSAMENVFRLLDGRKHGTDGYYSEIEIAIKALEPGDDCRGETTYFKFRGHRKGTLHIEFTRPDLVGLFNRVAGGGALPQKTGEKRRGPTAADVLADAVERSRDELRLLPADFFETPWALAEQTVERLELRDGLVVLEPSAGRGALVRAVAKVAPECAIDAIELDPAHTDDLRASLAAVRTRDFLQMDPAEEFDRVVMNPPFSRSRDVLHVAHAFRFLKPGGTLVAIMSGGAAFREDKLSRAFRDLVAQNDGEIWNNDARAFKDSGTNVRTITVRLRKAVA